MNERDIFVAALQKEHEAERQAFLREVRRDDPELGERVEDLLRAHPDARSFLESPAPAPTLAYTPPPPCEGSGTVVGPYKLLEPIGEGGTGTVFMAEQAHPVRRKVALKVIKPGMDTKQVIARFEAERQALALMDHPNIARVLDAGATDSGRPYFVMELVCGIPVTDYCDREQLTVPERLELFVLVCRAVQHAHQKGVIHRDLKPSNVLVTVIDGVAVPKVIDFGVAKATGQSLTERTLFTGFHQFVGTPLYMSPEQADLAGVDVDTRSDVYSLGVLLYELLTGTTPFDRKTFQKAAFDEVRRIVREQEPPRPSTRLSALGDSLATVSARRKAAPRQLGHAVRGELDWIVMRALEKDRRRRYETANDFAADVMRHLTDRPVEACPPSPWYRLTKSARLNRVALATAAMVAAALLIGLAASIAMAFRAVAAERRTAAALGKVREGLAEADLQRARARRAVDDMYTQVAEKWLSRDGALTPLQRQFLEKALAFYEDFARERADDPEARAEEARAAARVGQIRDRLGLTAEAMRSHRQALDAWRLLAAEFPGRPEYRRGLALSLFGIGGLHMDLDQTREAEQAHREALALRERLSEDPGLPDDRLLLANSLGHLGALLDTTGRGDEAGKALIRAAGLMTRLAAEFPKESRYQSELADAEINLGNLHNQAERCAEAETHCRRALDLGHKLADADPADADRQDHLVVGHHNLAETFRHRHDYAKAAEEYRSALSVAEQLTADHPDRPQYRKWVAENLVYLAEVLVALQQFDEAERLLRRSREVSEKLAADFPEVPVHRETVAHAWMGLGKILANVGRSQEARQAFERACEAQRRLFKDHPDVSVYRQNLAATCYDAAVNYATLTGRDGRDTALARELAREAVEVKPQEAGFWKGLALAEYRAGDLDAALKAETMALELRKSDGYYYDWLLLALIHLDRGDRAEARKWAGRVYGGKAPGTVQGPEVDFTRLARESEARLRSILDDDDPPRPEP
jgi:serine/threonine protein kinase/tetratricopeptide (TPR) repeat protein